MTNEELIIHQAKKIIELQSNMEYWMHRFFEAQEKKKEILSEEKVHEL
jgi:hypothetical protein